jgi:predicted methyltransferase
VSIELSKKIVELGNRVEIRESEIFKVLGLLSKNKKIANNDLVRMCGLPKTQLQSILTGLSEYLMPASRFVELKPGVDLNIEVNNYNYKSKIISLISKYQKERPIPERNYDQFLATVATTARRTCLMDKMGDITGRDVAIIGDDDLNSIAVAIQGKAKRIVSLEIDQRIIELIKKISEDHKLRIETYKYDVHSHLPDELAWRFDTVLMDPPYTKNGMSLFINRGIKLVKPKLTSRIYCAYSNSDRARERELEIQKCILEKNLLIKEKKYQFCRYNGAESIGSRSSLYLLDWTNQTKVTVVATGKFYTYE